LPNQAFASFGLIDAFMVSPILSVVKVRFSDLLVGHPMSRRRL
jgi:hypothetical protein